jgi:thioredoxin-like negative regulator of GroEL
MPSSPAFADPLPGAAASPVTWVVCLCAEWCGLCRDYEILFAQMAARYPAFRFAWLDIEDQSDVVGDIDVETFPTLLLADAQGTHFFGPLTPQANTLSRLLDSLQDASLRAAPHAPCIPELLQALQAAPAHWVKA